MNFVILYLALVVVTKAATKSYGRFSGWVVFVVVAKTLSDMSEIPDGSFKIKLPMKPAKPGSFSFPPGFRDHVNGLVAKRFLTTTIISD